MQAYILAAGYGTRMGGMTTECPKPMLKICGRPLLSHVIENLARAGVSRVGINLHFLPEMIVDYFGDGRRWGVQIHYSHEPKLLGTAGGVRRMFNVMPPEDSFLVHYGDVVTDQDLVPLVEFHAQSAAKATMLVHERPNSNSVAVMNDRGCVVRFLERPTPEERAGITSCWTNSAITVCRREIFDDVPPGNVCDLPRDVFPQLVDRRQLFAYRLQETRFAIDSPERLSLAEQYFCQKQPQSRPRFQSSVRR